MNHAHFPPHASLGWIGRTGRLVDAVDAGRLIECRAYETTCWITAAGRTSTEAFGKIAAYARAFGVEPPVPAMTGSLAPPESAIARRSDDDNVIILVRMFAYLEDAHPLTALATSTFAAFSTPVGVFYEPRRLAFAMPFEGTLVDDDEVRRRTARFRRVLGRSAVPGTTRRRDALFATYDTSTPQKFSRRNEIVLFV